MDENQQFYYHDVRPYASELFCCGLKGVYGSDYVGHQRSYGMGILRAWGQLYNESYRLPEKYFWHSQF
ncbi:MAG: hypothetical protein HQK67_07710 [Desulfamplus sp.]|nr:hypothetical protein [Desulfamplus sp.]